MCNKLKLLVVIGTELTGGKLCLLCYKDKVITKKMNYMCASESSKEHWYNVKKDNIPIGDNVISFLECYSEAGHGKLTSAAATAEPGKEEAKEYLD